MEDLSATEVARRFSEVLDAVEHNRASFLVTRHGKPVAKIAPVAGASGKALKELLRRHRPDPEFERDLREVRDLLYVEERDWKD